MSQTNITLKVLNTRYVVCKLSLPAKVPSWIDFNQENNEIVSVTRTSDELSIVCPEFQLPENVNNIHVEKNWSCLKIIGLLDFSLVGILSRISTILANAEISIFALSTFNTDYIMLKHDKLQKAFEALRVGGYQIQTADEFKTNSNTETKYLKSQKIDTIIQPPAKKIKTNSNTETKYLESQKIDALIQPPTKNTNQISIETKNLVETPQTHAEMPNVPIEIGKTPTNTQLESTGKWNVLMLGTGSSTSVPRIGCVIRDNTKCYCNRIPFSSYNHRLNPSIMLSRSETNTADYNIIVDIGKTFRESAIRHFKHHNIRNVDTILITHFHMDAIGGLDDFRDVQVSGTKAKIFANCKTMEFLKSSYSYLFGNADAGLFVASLDPHVVEDYKPIVLLDLEIIPIPLHHGSIISYGYIFHQLGSSSQFVYFSDFRCKSSAPIPTTPRHSPPEITTEDFENLTFLVNAEKAISILQKYPISAMILDSLHPEMSYISHSSLPETLKIIETLKRRGIIAEKFILTGLGCGFDYVTETKKLCQKYSNIELGFDGLTFQM